MYLALMVLDHKEIHRIVESQRRAGVSHLGDLLYLRIPCHVCNHLTILTGFGWLKLAAAASAVDYVVSRMDRVTQRWPSNIIKKPEDTLGTKSS